LEYIYIYKNIVSHITSTAIVYFFSGNSVRRVFACVLGRPPNLDFGKCESSGADLGQGSEVLDPWPVHQATERNESANAVPGLSVDTVVRQQHAPD